MNSEVQNKFHSHTWEFYERIFASHKEIGVDGFASTYYYRCSVCGSFAIGEDETTGPFCWDDQTPILDCSEAVCKGIIE